VKRRVNPRVNQAEYAIRFHMAAPQEYVNTFKHVGLSGPTSVGGDGRNTDECRPGRRGGGGEGDAVAVIWVDDDTEGRCIEIERYTCMRVCVYVYVYIYRCR